MKIMKTLDEEFRPADQSLINYYKTLKMDEMIDKIPLKVGSGSITFGLNTIRINKPS